MDTAKHHLLNKIYDIIFFVFRLTKARHPSYSRYGGSLPNVAQMAAGPAPPASSPGSAPPPGPIHHDPVQYAMSGKETNDKYEGL